MATKFQMQAKSSTDFALRSWLADAPDWLGTGYATAGYPGTPLDIALAGGGIDTSSGSGGDLVTSDGVTVTSDGVPVTV